MPWTWIKTKMVSESQHFEYTIQAFRSNLGVYFILYSLCQKKGIFISLILFLWPHTRGAFLPPLPIYLPSPPPSGLSPFSLGPSCHPCDQVYCLLTWSGSVGPRSRDQAHRLLLCVVTPFFLRLFFGKCFFLSLHEWWTVLSRQLVWQRDT